MVNENHENAEAIRSLDLKACLSLAVDVIRINMPEGSDLEEWFNMAPSFDADSLELTYNVGYLNGIADALNVTVIELLDEYEVNYSNEG